MRILPSTLKNLFLALTSKHPTSTFIFWDEMFLMFYL